MTAEWSPGPGIELVSVEGSLDGPWLLARLRFEPDALLAEEQHLEHDETIVVLQGAVAVSRAGSILWACAADGFPLRISTGSAHSIRAGSHGAEILSIVRRTGPSARTADGAGNLASGLRSPVEVRADEIEAEAAASEMPLTHLYAARQARVSASQVCVSARERDARDSTTDVWLLVARRSLAREVGR